MKQSTLDITEIRLQKVVDHEQNYTFPEFLIELRKTLGRTRQVVAYELDLEYDALLRMESGKSRVFSIEKTHLLAEYYGVNTSLLEEKARKWTREMKKKYPSRNP